MFGLLTLPFKNPVLIFTFVLLIILLTPILFKKLRIPGIIGLIISGFIFGPHGFNILEKSAWTEIFSTIGLLYLMFLAGLDIELTDFKKHKHRSLVFGFLTFAVPLVMGFAVCYFFLDFPFKSALLLASIFSTQTLISYPIVTRLGIIHNNAVLITVGGTIITDVAVLVLLTIIKSSTLKALDLSVWIEIFVKIAGLVIVVIWIMPKIGRWFFKNHPGEGTSRYIFILTVVFFSGFLADLAGIEPIIGAFLAGLAMNNLVPKSSLLKNRIDFIGHSLFIPFFLISVGMIINLDSLVHSKYAMFISIVFVATGLITKFVAAWFTQLFFKYSVNERNLIFGLSSSHAAATLAVVLVGYNLKLFDTNILNAVFIIIIVSCLFSSFVTEMAGKKIAVLEDAGNIEISDNLREKTLVAFANPASLDRLLEIATLIHDYSKKGKIHLLSVVLEDHDAEKNLRIKKHQIDRVIKNYATDENLFQIHQRIDLNIANGISKSLKELDITTLIIGWNKRTTTMSFLFGTILENVLDKVSQMILVVKSNSSFDLITRIVVDVPKYAELEIGFSRWVNLVIQLAKQKGCSVLFVGVAASMGAIKYEIINKKYTASASYKTISDHLDTSYFGKELDSSDLFTIINARIGTVSYHAKLDLILKKSSKKFEKINYILIYPEQKNENYENLSSKVNDIISPITRILKN